MDELHYNGCSLGVLIGNFRSYLSLFEEKLLSSDIFKKTTFMLVRLAAFKHKGYQ